MLFISLCTLFSRQVGSPEEKDVRHLPTVFGSLANEILNECYDTFVSCFHAFYPTPALKWNCLCDLLGHIQPVRHM